MRKGTYCNCRPHLKSAKDTPVLWCVVNHIVSANEDIAVDASALLEVDVKDWTRLRSVGQCGRGRVHCRLLREEDDRMSALSETVDIKCESAFLWNALGPITRSMSADNEKRVQELGRANSVKRERDLEREEGA